MRQAIANLGGWLLMMGQHDRSESLFYYFRIEDQVPENHLLRLIDGYVSCDFVLILWPLRCRLHSLAPAYVCKRHSREVAWGLDSFGEIDFFRLGVGHLAGPPIEIRIGGITSIQLIAKDMAEGEDSIPPE
jgi:hypothetical protein